ncbi:MAG: hypothetical protein Q8P36_00330 [bacterium]|nr:hypothetical protein [bacterium]
MRSLALMACGALLALGSVSIAGGTIDPVVAYKKGELLVCNSSEVVAPEVADTVAILDEKDATTLFAWVRSQFGRQEPNPPRTVLFVHGIAKPEYADGALFTYFVLEKTPSNFCYSGNSMNGTMPFNRRFLEKYKNPSS